VCTVLAVRRGASEASALRPGEPTEWLIARRGLLRALPAGGGSLVALSTMALGAGNRMTPGEEEPGVVVLLGGGGSLLVALVHVPVALALRARAHGLSAGLFALAGTDDPAALLERTEQRDRFEQLLGAGAGTFADLQSGVVVLAPLLAVAAAVWLPRQPGPTPGTAAGAPP
jgi:hypothetical protein